MKNPAASSHREDDDDDDDEELEDGKSHTLDERGRKPKASSEKEKEKTKIRERHRRSITTKILTGLRKYGNYNLPPRADVNDVLRALATEAGWVVEADGTTYRSPALQQTSGTQSHPGLRHISSLNRVSLNPGSMTLPSLTPTPSVSSLGSMGGFNCALPPIITDPIDPRGGDCSTTASPRHISSSSINLLHPNSALSSPFTSPASSEGGQSVQFANPFLPGVFPSGFLSADGRDVLGIRDDTVAAFLSGDMMEPRELLSGRSPVGTPTSSLIGNPPSNLLLNPAQTGFYPAPLGPMSYNTRTALPSVMMFPQQHPFLQESRASNQNTPIGSPQPHGGNM